MSGIKDKDHIDEVRRRLYERGEREGADASAYALTDTPSLVTGNWIAPASLIETLPTDPRIGVLTEPELVIEQSIQKKIKRHYSYRAIILLVTMGIFLLVLGGTSLYLFTGTNQISNKNIGIAITGPLTIGGGEILPLQLTVTNQNTVPIESAVLIVSYPTGTKAADDSGRDIFEERVTLDRINAGEAINIPVKAILFGEENQEREIKATVEYRLVESNGTFYKEADPFIITINSSPLVLRVTSVEKVSSGQEVAVTMTLQSNSASVLKNILVSASYPKNFDFTSAIPSPVYRESEWIVAEINPNESVTIVLKGRVEGGQDEEFQMQFSAGSPRQDNQFILGSVLANATADFLIEQPFIDMDLSINGAVTDVVTLKTGDGISVQVSVTNTLSESIYDMAVEVGISGNIFPRESVQVQNGYYDSVKDIVRFEVSGDKTLYEVEPGQTRRFNFSLRPDDSATTPGFAVTANAFARRVNEDSVTENLIGTAKSEARYTSSANLTRQISRNSSTFTDSGPIPPVADAKTTYTITLQASAGANDVTGTVVSTSIPQYATWENKTAGAGSIEFNPVTKEITWSVGGIDAGTTKEFSFQVGIVPSQNQIGSVPAVLGAQQLRATDSFTDTVIRAEGLPLSATLSSEAGFPPDSGKVIREVVESDGN